jgi:hypothetical protein
MTYINYFIYKKNSVNIYGKMYEDFPGYTSIVLKKKLFNFLLLSYLSTFFAIAPSNYYFNKGFKAHIYNLFR